MTRSRGPSRLIQFAILFAALGALFVAPRIAIAAPIRLLVAVGSRDGLSAELPIRYADSDASRVRDVLVRQGGFLSGATEILREPSRSDLLAALARTRDRAQGHEPSEVTVLFYFSGHGDREAIHLPGDRFLLTELERELSTIAAGLRIVVTDACRSVRDKGFTDDAPFVISLGPSAQARGTVWFHASGDGEVAQESDELEGALFTHAWLSGLRGAADANADARVTLEESFAFAHAQTMIRSATTSGVLQRPEAVMALREFGPVVLTQSGRALAGISLPRGRDAHYIVYEPGQKSVLAEVWGADDRTTTLRVPPGPYVVLRRAGGHGAVARFALAVGEVRDLTSSDFSAASAEQVAAKGSADRGIGEIENEAQPPLPRRHELNAGYAIGSVAQFGVTQGPTLAYGYRFREAFVGLIGAGVGFSDTTVNVGTAMNTGWVGRVSVEYRKQIPGITLRLGAGGRAGMQVQKITRSDSASLQAGGYSGQTTRFAGAAGPELYAGFRLRPWQEWLFGDLGASGGVLLVQENGQVLPLLALGMVAGLGAAF